jgi:uncharacterized protein involved in response to NO
MPEPALRPRWALSANGFRPFFLLAALFACAIVPLWMLVVAGILPPSVYLDAASWHAHEMVVGYTIAVIAGFSLTAVGNWTQRETLIGVPLLALSTLWLLGRVAMISAGALPRGMPAVVDLAFLPALAAVLARPLVGARNRRNYVMLAVLGALFAANLVVHLSALGVTAIGSPRRACLVAIDVVLILILIVTGRVVPMFTRNATGVASIRSSPRLDALAIAGMAVLTVLDALIPDTWGVAAVAGAAGVLALARTVHWGTRHSLHHPLLWILHAGYLWVPLGLLLRALTGFDANVSGVLATHALTIGAIGSLTLGMMARVALGHTGRVLIASKPMAWGFGAMTAAAFVRAILPLFAPRWYFAELVAGAGLWTVAFVLYLVEYVPVLSVARMDGKAG